MAVERKAFRDAMARLGAAVNIVTTAGEGGRCGFTASAVCSVTDDPPTLLVCVNRSNDSSMPLRRNGVVCINTLGAHHRELSPIFAGSLPDDSMDRRFEHGDWFTLETGAPALRDAAVIFDCRIMHDVAIGTHDVLFCEVQQTCLGDRQEALIYYGRAYHAVGEPDGS